MPSMTSARTANSELGGLHTSPLLRTQRAVDVLKHPLSHTKTASWPQQPKQIRCTLIQYICSPDTLISRPGVLDDYKPNPFE